MEKIRTGAAPIAGSFRPDRQAIQLLSRLSGATAVAFAMMAAFAAYEAVRPSRGLPPLYDPFASIQLACSAVAAGLIVWTIYSERAVAHGFERDTLPAVSRSAAAAVVGVALGSTVLLLADPILFGATTAQGGSVEWITALLLLASFALFVRAALRHSNKLVPLAFAAVSFILAVEETNWAGGSAGQPHLFE